MPVTKIQTRINPFFPAALLAALMPGYTPVSYAADTFGLGLTLNGGTLEGDNGSGRGDFESDRGGQFTLSLNYRSDRFYTGVNLQGGKYDFDGRMPDQFTSLGAISSRNDKVRHEDFDLLVGYYFWPNVSLFLDLKVTQAEWQNTGYEQAFSGLGFGVSGYHPLDESWLLFGSFGLVNGDLDDNDEDSIGDGEATTLIFGAVYRIDDDDTINFGVKLRSFKFDYDDGNEQEFTLNGPFFGYNHVFDW